MRLHRLSVGHVKGIESGTITFPDCGVSVLVGPNEAGKTTLMAALDLLLEEKDSSRKRHVLAMQPIGCDVASWVEAEMSAGPYRFTYRKQWFRQPATELTIVAPSVQHLVGVPAHERVQEILAATTDLTLWKALRLLQASPLVPPDLGGSSALTAALDAAAGAAVDPGAEGDSLVAAAESENARYFTAGKGQPTGEYREAIDALGAVRDAEREAAAAVAEVTVDVDRHDDVCAASRDTQEQVREARSRHAELQERWSEVSGLVERHQVAEREFAAATREAERAEQRRAERATLVDELDDRAELVATQREDARRAMADLDPQEERLRELQTQLRAAAEETRAATAAVERADRATARARRLAQAALLADRVARAQEADRDRRDASSELARRTVDEAVVRRLEKLSTVCDLAVSRQEAESARVVLVGLAEPGTVLVDGDALVLGEGEECERSVSEPLEVAVPGRIVVRVRPESGAGERAAAVENARRDLADELAAAGVPDVDSARQAADERRRVADRLARADDRLADVLADALLPDLEDELARLRAKDEMQDDARQDDEKQDDETRDEGAETAGARDETGEASAAGQPVASEDETGEEGARERLARAAEEEHSLSARVEAFRSGVEAARMEHARADSVRGAVERELSAATERLERLRALESDEALADAASEAREACRRASRARDELAAQLAAYDPQALDLQVASAAARVKAAEERLAGLRDERLAIEARLEFSGRQGRYDALEAARGDLEHAERRLAAVSRRADAARLLHETLQAHRVEATRAYVAPFVEAIERLGAVVYGPDFAVEVGDDLRVLARVAAGRRVDYEALSTGAREQLALLTRLTVACLVDPEDGVPLVIDDALAFTDPQRLDRMAAAFALLSESVQVILLTCDPGRYDGIVGAHREDFARHFRTAQPAHPPLAMVGAAGMD